LISSMYTVKGVGSTMKATLDLKTEFA
jgi:hypothetical protein